MSSSEEKWDSVVLKENDNLEVLRFVGVDKNG